MTQIKYYTAHTFLLLMMNLFLDTWKQEIQWIL